MSKHPRKVSWLTGMTAIIASLALVAAACSQPAAAPTPAPTKVAPTPASAQPKTSPAATQAPTQPAKAKIDYPTRPITVIAPFAAGGPLDVGARIMASFLEKELGQPVQVVNKPGASGQVGNTEAANSKPDGYTLVIPGSPTFEAGYLDPQRGATYTRKSFAPVANQVIDPNTFSVRSDSPYRTLGDLIKAAKEKPETITTGDSGLMTDDHLAILAVEQMTGARFNMTHFSGGGPAQTALHGGHIDVLVGNIGDAMAGYKSGQFRVLGVASDERTPFLPDVPTFKEQGVNLVAAVSRGWLAPAGTPPEIIKVLEAAMKKVDAIPEYREKMTAAGLPAKFMGTEEYDKYLQAEEKRVAELLKNLQPK